MVVVPLLIPLARPPALMSAAAELDELQVACEVRSCVLLSENTPVAVNCTLPLMPTTVVTGVTTMFVSVAEVTFSEAVAVMES